ncbi:MAG: cysteine--tRNA ligase [Pseudomonadota bacterium]
MAPQLRLYNTLTRGKDDFVPADETNVRFYVCGPTVYDFAHIGNARPAITFDTLFRVLRHRYGADHVTYVRNITDVDDKINARARERGVPIETITEETLGYYLADVAALGCLPPSHSPRATEHIKAMVWMIDRLVEKGNAYIAEEHALFSVSTMSDYGALSKRNPDEMLAGARVEVAPYKRDPLDFVLWKPSFDGDPGWPGPVGITTPGRPGWHIECSAMSHAFLGETFDIHGGGIDLAFPHHENERAQTKAVFGIDEMVSIWMHNGFLQVEGRKMSKSEGNFLTIRDALAKAPGPVLRLAMLMTHYRQPIDWSAARLAEATTVLNRWQSATGGEGPIDEAVEAALFDDLNTPSAIQHLTRLARAEAPGLDASAALLGFDLPALRAAASERTAPADLDARVAARLEARARKDFAAADAIRDGLAAEGIVLTDARGDDGQLTTQWAFADDA